MSPIWYVEIERERERVRERESERARERESESVWVRGQAKSTQRENLLFQTLNHCDRKKPPFQHFEYVSFVSNNHYTHSQSIKHKSTPHNQRATIRQLLVFEIILKNTKQSSRKNILPPCLNKLYFSLFKKRILSNPTRVQREQWSAWGRRVSSQATVQFLH